MKQFFRIFFRDSTQTASGDGDPFHSLYMLTTTLGFHVYALIFEVVVFLIIIMTGIAFVKGYAAKDAQGRVENKDKIMRNIIILLVVVSLTFIISTTYKIFSWTA